MNAQQAENLRILIRHMETKCQRPTLFMGQVHYRCNTPACAIGEAAFIGVGGLSFPAYDPAECSVMLRGGRTFYTDAAHEVFGTIDPFLSGITTKRGLTKDPTPQEWALEARKVLAEHGYSMDTVAEWASAKVAQMAALGPYEGELTVPDVQAMQANIAADKLR
jgi:hypothetical protein